MRKFAITVSLAVLTSCSTESPRQTQTGIYQIKERVWTAYSYDSAKNTTFSGANKKCAELNRSMEPVSGDFTNDSVGTIYLLNFRCYDAAERASQARAEKQRLDAQRAEQARQAELEKQRQEAEWERGRPEREAAARAAEARERSRLNGLCPIYYLARQTCANAGNGYQQCMSIRIGRSYSSWDDNTCFNR